MSHPSTSSLPPVPAASLILLREGDGLEVLVGRRWLKARAFPGAIVFPGGKLEAQDAGRLQASNDIEPVAAHGALREMFEETGLLICALGEGPPTDCDIGRARREVEAGELEFADLLRSWDRRLDLDRLVPFAHWITPQGAPYRFDTYFFLAAASAVEAGAPLIFAEFEELSWRRPDDLLREEPRRLMTPTRHCLTSLAMSSDVAGAMTAARSRGPYDGERERSTRGD